MKDRIEDMAVRNLRASTEGERVKPSTPGQNECPLHPKAARCFHRGDAWMAEYRFKNGRWRLDVVSPMGRMTLMAIRPTISYAEEEWAAQVESLREEINP